MLPPPHLLAMLPSPLSLDLPLSMDMVLGVAGLPRVPDMASSCSH